MLDLHPEADRARPVTPQVSQWRMGARVLQWSGRPLWMGILNVTPDSFSDGGLFFETDRAVAHGFKLLDAGVDLLDVGGESSRPGSLPVPVGEQIDRVVPVIRAIKKARPQAVISIDAYRAEVVAAALEAGAEVINDISAGRWDPELWSVVSSSEAGYVCMHASAPPDRMQQLTQYQDVVMEVKAFLLERFAALQRLGVPPERIVLDPGIGFGKTAEDNLRLLRAGGTWSEMPRPILWGVSRKSFLTRSVQAELEHRDALDGVVHAWLGLWPYPQIWRVHNPSMMQAVLRMILSLSGQAESTACWQTHAQEGKV